MSRKLLFATLYLGLFLLSSAQAHGQKSELVTAQNIISFGLFRADISSGIACRAKGAERRLGRLSLAGKPSPIAIGALFTPLSPSVSQREARLRKQINSSIRALKRPSSSKAKKQARIRLQRVKRELSLLSSYTSWCNTFVPGSSDGSYPSPTPPHGVGNTPIEQFFVKDDGEAPTHTCAPTLVGGTVTGGGTVVVTIANDSFIESQNASGGSFSFPYVPAGVYSLFAESEGASYGPAHKVIVRSDGDCSGISLVRQEVPSTSSFAFRWKQQASLTSGMEQSTRISTQPSTAAATLNSLATPEVPASAQSSAADYLLQRFKITLDSSALSWSAEHAERLRLAFDNIFPETRGDSPIQKSSFWVLTSDQLPNDIELAEVNDTIEVRINTEAFRYAALTPAILDGVRGEFFSERLTLATVRFLSRNGRDRGLVEQILFERYRFRVVNDLSEACSLTYTTSRECGESFQFFTNEELLQLLGAIAQLPPPSDPQAAYTQTPLIRRKTGVRHPSRALDKIKVIPYSGANVSVPYIEVAAEAFLPPSEMLLGDPRQPNKEILLLGIVGANASILWDTVLTQELRDAWVTETGWSFDSISKFWSNDNLTELGAPLPAGVVDSGPRGDFATSVAKYIASPEELRFRSSRRFEFLKLYIMHGLRYSRQFREDLKFPVLNLRPDFSYPGKVNGLEVVVTGEPEEHKLIRMRVTLEGSDPLEHGARMAYVNLRHRGTGTPLNLNLVADRPDPVYGTSLVLRGYHQVSKYQPGGFYDLVSIVLIDGVDNMRFNNRKDVGFRFFLKNTAEMPKPAELLPESIKLTLTETAIEGVTVPTLTTVFKVTNPEALLHAQDYQIALNESRVPLSAGARVTRVKDTVQIARPVSPFLPSGIYGVPILTLANEGSISHYLFSLDGGMRGDGVLPMPLLEYENSNGDETAPEIDLNGITVRAESLSPDKPNGATKVVVRVRARDNLSGLRDMNFCLLSPLNRSVCNSFDLGLKTGVLPEGTTEFKEYESTIYLPAGSAPGDWGINFIASTDRVGNHVNHPLTEIVKFIVDNKGGN